MNKARALSLGITSGVVIACGILIAVLVYMLGMTIIDGYESETGTSSSDVDYSVLKSLTGPYWLVALMYLVPGVLAFIAAFVQNKCVYIISCMLSILCVLIMGLALFMVAEPMAVVMLALYKYGKTCTDEAGNGCVCERSDSIVEYSHTPFKECDYMHDAINLFIAVGVLIALAWLFLVVSFVITVVFACRSKQTHGAVYTPAQQPMLTH